MPAATKNVDWEAIRKACERGATYKAVAEHHGVSHDAVMRRASRECWRHSTRRAVTKAASAMFKDAPQLRAATAAMVADKTSTQVAGMVAGLVSDALRMSKEIMNRGHETAMAAETARDLKDATIAFGIAHQHARLALGMDRADGLRSGQPWAQPANVIDVQTVPAPEPAKPIDV